MVIAPHPDDEVLGAGATMARFSEEGHEVYVCIVTRGRPPMFDEASVERVRREAAQADRSLGVRKTIFLEGFPAALLDTIPHSRLNAALAEVVDDVNPEVLLIPHAGDLHMDHRLVFESALVAVRPTARPSPRSVLAYETLSETDWKAPRVGPSFEPTTHVEVGPYLERKLDAMRIFESQVKDFPHPRSLESLRALARMRGGSVGFEAAEAFMMVREVRPLAD